MVPSSSFKLAVSFCSVKPLRSLASKHYPEELLEDDNVPAAQPLPRLGR